MLVNKSQGQTDIGLWAIVLKLTTKVLKLVEGGAVAQRLERSFLLPGVLGSNPIGDKNFGASGMKLISTSRVFSGYSGFLPHCNNGIGRSPQKYKNLKLILNFRS